MPNRGEVSPITPRDIALVQIEAELRHQDNLWGYEHDKYHTDADWLMLVMKQVGKMSDKVINDEPIGRERMQCAALLVAWSSHRGEVNDVSH